LKNILGIGTAGSNIVKQLSNFKVYQPYTVSTENKKTTKYNFKIPTLPGPEEYESMDTEKLYKWLNTIDKSCTVFLCGASNSSGLVLRALHSLHLRGVKMDIVYFTPEIEVLSEEKTLQERSCRGILQNYARSGLFEKICLVSNLRLEEFAGPTNVFDYYDQINHVFTSTYYMLDVFKNSKPVTSTFKRPKESCRITTIGLGSLEKDDLLFFPFNQEVEVVYYYGIKEEKLKTQENLFRTITNKVKSRITDETKVSFGIYPTQYEEDYIYVEYFSPKIQQIVVDNKETI
tara:strand:+ start:184 stop:1050 length:867 start_codon:yes stop_codon:yes gene_type:complete